MDNKILNFLFAAWLASLISLISKYITRNVSSPLNYKNFILVFLTRFIFLLLNLLLQFAIEEKYLIIDSLSVISFIYVIRATYAFYLFCLFVSWYYTDIIVFSSGSLMLVLYYIERQHFHFLNRVVFYEVIFTLLFLYIIKYITKRLSIKISFV